MTHYKADFTPKIALYEPDIPQNTAAIIRTCACLGAQLEIIEPCGFLLSDKRFKRVVMDYINIKNINFHQSAEDFFKAKSNERVILITTKAKKIYTDFKFNKQDTLLFGKESACVPKKVHNLLKEKIRIPMVGKKRSLNLSTSVAIILSESLRQIKL